MPASWCDHQEAIAHFRKGISLARELPGKQERLRAELKLQFALGGAYLQMAGHFAPEVESTFVRARELCGAIEDAPELVPTLFGLWRSYVVKMINVEKPKEIADELIRLTAREGSTVARDVAQYATGFTAFIMGEFTTAREHLREGIRLYSLEDRDKAAVYRFGQDPGVACHCYLALTEWALGFPDKALTHAEDGLSLAARIGDPFTTAFSYALSSFIDQLRGDGAACLLKSQSAINIARDKGFPYWAGIGEVMQAWCEADRDPTEEMILAFKNRIERHRGHGTDLFAPYFLNLLGELLTRSTDLEECSKAFDENESIQSRTGERWCESETNRIQGDLALVWAGEPAKAEQYYKSAVTMAKEKEARSFELRAAVRLANLWRRTKSSQEAQALLAPLYEEFTEGFGTADLQTAKSLINDLRAQRLAH